MKLIQYSTPLSLSQFFLQEPYNDSIVRLINPFTILAVPFIQKSPDLRPFPRVLFVQLIDDPCQGSVTISFQQSVIQIQHFVDFPVIGIVRASYRAVSRAIRQRIHATLLKQIKSDVAVIFRFITMKIPINSPRTTYHHIPIIQLPLRILLPAKDMLYAGSFVAIAVLRRDTTHTIGTDKSLFFQQRFAQILGRLINCPRCLPISCP